MSYLNYVRGINSVNSKFVSSNSEAWDLVNEVNNNNVINDIEDCCFFNVDEEDNNDIDELESCFIYIND